MSKPSGLRQGAFLAVFLLSVAVLLGGLDHLLSSSFKPWSNPEWTGKVSSYERAYGNRTPEVLFLGDSTVSVGARPAAAGWDAAFNLGRSGLIPRELPALDARLEALKLRPKTIYLSITPSMFFSPRWELNQDAPLADKVRYGFAHFYDDPNGFGPLFLPGRILVRGPVRQVAMNLGGKHLSTFYIDQDGANVSTVKAALGEAQSESITLPPEAGDPAYVAGLEADLKAFKARWNARGVKVVWVLWPLHPKVMAGLLPEDRRGYETYLGILGRTFQGSDLLDLRASMPGSAFLDAIHLSPEGARDFTGLLKQTWERGRGAGFAG